jgi:hypothetical protein
MTEEEWFAAGPYEIREASTRLGPGRQRLFAVAVCRVLLQWINYPAVHAALEAVEIFAETGKSKAALRRARQAVQTLRMDIARGQLDGATDLALFVVQMAASENAVSGTIGQAIEVLARAEHISVEAARRRFYPTYQEIAGPAPPVAFSPEWRTSTAVQLARTMYDAREFSGMPILADALQDAGCDSDELLAHCRDPQAVHVRGCWVVDLVLGKT